MKLLVVEDDPNLAMLWGKVFEGSGYEVLLTDTEEGALRALQSAHFDLVVLDLCLHGKRALGVATMATYRNPRCKVIVVTGSADFSRRTLFAMSPAVAAALHKPVDIEDLVDACNVVMRGPRPVPMAGAEARTVEFRP